jgi:2-isopropylmalate synthase
MLDRFHNGKSMNIEIYDTTLRDGAQSEGISFSLEDKIKVTHCLVELGIPYIEAGNPYSNPRDASFFQYIKENPIKGATICAFGSTRRINIRPEQDANLLSLINCGASTVTIFGKSWDFHVLEVLRTTKEENLNMIHDSITFLVKNGKTVFFDAEHFFDGYISNKEYALRVLETAYHAGAQRLILCDTNGGVMLSSFTEIVKSTVALYPGMVGVHCHNDTDLATALSVEAALNGAIQIQGTINGLGERCGNANLCSIIPTLTLKLHIPTVHRIHKLYHISHIISTIANVHFNENTPYIGNSAFAHKGGMHIDAVGKNPKTFEHVDPQLVGNSRRLLLSELSGRSAVLTGISKIAPDIPRESEQMNKICDVLKHMEYMGYQFEGAETTFELMVLRALGRFTPFYQVNDFRILSEQPNNDTSAIAMINIAVDGRMEVTADYGDGPVNALDKAFKKALFVFYPLISDLYLNDFKVRVVDTGNGTASKVRVHIESSYKEKRFFTLGVSENILQAAFLSLCDSIDAMLMFAYKNT